MQEWTAPTGYNGMMNLQLKLKRVRKRLSQWNWDVFGDVFARVRQADVVVAVSQASYDSSPTLDARAELSRCVDEYVLRTWMEEDFWKQKAAVRWVTEGERNSHFFQGWVKQRRCKSRIHSIEDDGRVIEDDDGIRASAAGFFQRLLTSDIDQLGDPDFSCLHGIPMDMDTDGLCRTPDIDEIRSAVFGISGDSVSGPDGFTSLFFQHCWDIVSSDVVGAVVDFFAGAHMPRSFTATTIVLLPKKERSLAPFLPAMLAPNQSGFVKGRLLSDNVLLAQEMIGDLHISRDVPNVALKLDMVKAYDRVQWSFLLAVLRHMGFPDQWVDMISRCIKDCWFSVLVNGVPAGRRSGDFPFLTCLMLMTSSSLLELTRMIQSVCGYQRGSLPFTYLGVPIYRGFLKCSLFIPLRQRLSDRIHSWSHRHLSFGGRLALIRSTLATIPLHIFQVMEPPQGVLHQLKQMIARFFSSSVGEKRKMHWISWETICLPISEGGLGIRRFGDLVTAFSWKLWWRFRARDSLWARYMWAKYCRGRLYPLRVPLGPHDSRVWKRVVRVGGWAQDHIRWSLGDGQVSFWDDIWCVDVPLSSYCPASRFDHLHVDWYLSGESWYVERLHALHEHFSLSVDLIDSVIRTPVMLGERDSMRWNFTSIGEFSLTSAWDQVRYRRPERAIFGSFWHDCLTPTISTFLWCLMHDRIPVDVRLQSRRIHLASRCQCFVDPQVQHHLHLLVSAGKLLPQHWLGCYPQVPFMPVADPVPRALRSRMVSWRPPEAPWVKLNTDGSFSTDLQMAAGGGGLVRDHTGSFLVSFCAPLRAASSFDAEFQDILHGLRLAVQYSDVWIEMDAASDVSVLQSARQGSAVTRHTLTSIRLLCRGRLVRFTHIHRKGNRVADFLAGRGAQTSALTFYDDVSAPPYLLSLVRMDQLGYPNFRFRYH
ncbi:hypothetical protein C2S52_009316 [Perilla frutescens var. hirtella]|nr:hypothetical protein C2S52_009316 [Perilla frutescens var. hirtella]